MENGWSLKKLHRLILTSSTFRQASHGQDWYESRRSAIAQDPENRLLWRMNSHRLSFEELRDSTLAAAGLLDRTVGGKPVNLFTQPYPGRRTLYGLVDRQFLPGTLRMFDFANPDLHIPQRSETTVPQQALFLMNHPMSLDAVRTVAEQAGAEDDLPAAVRRLYENVLRRSPTSEEVTQALQFLAAGETTPTPMQSATVPDWSYGFGEIDETKKCVASFEPLPHFTGAAWQGGEKWPDPKLGWVQLTAAGGHPGNDRAHASIRRWTASADMSVDITSTVIQTSAPGDGIRVFIVSSRQGILESATLHQQTISLNAPQLTVKEGETIDFLCDIGDILNSDEHEWRIRVSSREPSEQGTVWDSEKDFTRTDVPALTPLEQFAQILLCSNEFFFID